VRARLARSRLVPHYLHVHAEPQRSVTFGSCGSICYQQSSPRRRCCMCGLQVRWVSFRDCWVTAADDELLRLWSTAGKKVAEVAYKGGPCRLVTQCPWQGTVFAPCKIVCSHQSNHGGACSLMLLAMHALLWQTIRHPALEPADYWHCSVQNNSASFRVLHFSYQLLLPPT